MIETVVESIRVNLVTENRVVFLKERHGSRHLPIWIGEFEAQAIAMEMQGIASPRPLPYDIMKAIIGEMEGQVERVLVTDLSQDVFYARIIIRAAGRALEIDARPSDAIALAVRTGATIFVDESVMERAGVSLDGEGDDEAVSPTVSEGSTPQATAAPEDESLSIFRDFINTLDLDDFDKGRGS